MKKLDFFPFLIFLLYKGVLRHRCTLNAIVAQYLSARNEVEGSLFCVPSALTVVFFITYARILELPSYTAY